MMKPILPHYTPDDWYYIVGGNGPHKAKAGDPWEADATRAWSTKKDAYVPYDNADYTAWRKRFGVLPPGVEPATRIPTKEAEERWPAAKPKAD